MSAAPDIFLVFPPLTEARLFPYLSLPMITGYLRAQGLHVCQRDLNLHLSHELFTSEAFVRYSTENAGLPHEEEQLYTSYRLAMADYLSRNCQSLRKTVFDRQEDLDPELVTKSIRFVRQGLDLLLEGSLLSRRVSSWGEIPGIVAEGGEAGLDLPAALLRSAVACLLAEARPAILAISIPFFSQIVPSLLLAKWAKESSPQTRIVVGGQQVMLWSAELAALPQFGRDVDFLGVGKGEETLHHLHLALRGERRIDEVPDLVRPSGRSGSPARGPRSSLHLRDLPPPDFTDLPIRRYMSAEHELAIITCIGCYWGRCVFCSYGNRSYKQDSYEQAMPHQIADTCQALVDRHCLTRINFVDENTNLTVVMHAVQMLEERGYRIRFSTRNRLEPVLLDESFCRELVRLGCVLMSCGYETRSQRLLDALNKGVRADQYQTIIDNLYRAGLPLRLSILGGIPGETVEEVQESFAFLKKNEKKIGIDVMQMLVAEPATLLAEEPGRYSLQDLSTDRLRGNEALSFGQGRVGYSFGYVSGESFATRLGRFMQLRDLVRPGQNDELPPILRRSPRDGRRPIRGVRLHPWVRLFPEVVAEPGAAPCDMIADLLWQRFFRLPEDFSRRWSGHDTVLAAHGNGRGADVQELLDEIVRLELGRAVYA